MRLQAAFMLMCFTAFAQDALQDFTQEPELWWKFETKSPLLASPLIEGETVYCGGLDSTLYAIQLRNGKLKWKFKTKGAIRSKPVPHQNYLLLNGGDGHLYALDATTGKANWTFRGTSEKKYDFADYHHSTPVINNGLIYFGSGDGNLYAISGEGKKIWSYQTGDAIHTTPAIHDSKVFFGSFDGNMYAVTADKGELLWKFKTVGQRYFPKGEVQGSPVIYKNLVIFGARDFNVYALDQNKGYSHWNRYLPRGWGLVNSIRDSVLYIGTGDERTFFALHPLTGREYWSKKMELLVFGGNAYSKNLLYVGTTMGKFHATDRKSGTTVWTYATDSYKKNHLKYFKQDDSYRDDIYTIIKTNEQFLDAQYEVGGIFSAPAITSEYLIFASTDGHVYCLKRKIRKVVHQRKPPGIKSWSP